MGWEININLKIKSFNMEDKNIEKQKESHSIADDISKEFLLGLIVVAAIFGLFLKISFFLLK